MSPRVIFIILSTVFFSLPAGAESFKSWAARGAREEREKDPQAAFSSYSNALSMWEEDDGKPAKAKVLCARAAILEAEKKDEEALKDYSACLALDKKNAKAFHRRGALRLKGGKIDDAISDFYRAVEHRRGFAAAFADRARAYELKGDDAFALEDHRRACELGVKASCAKAKKLAPAKGRKAAPKKAPAPEDAPSEAAAAEEGAAPYAETAVPAPAPDEAPAKAKASAAKPAAAQWTAPYTPRFRDCIVKLEACVEEGGSFGSCVKAAPACEDKPKKGCCPAACLKAYNKAVNRDRSEAQAFRENFSLDSPCGVPPKEEEEE